MSFPDFPITVCPVQPPVRQLFADGEWLVPEDQRPRNWQQITLPRDYVERVKPSYPTGTLRVPVAATPRQTRPAVQTPRVERVPPREAPAEDGAHQAGRSARRT
jgi:hypothetical protein